jgi:hypothetical protein
VQYTKLAEYFASKCVSHSLLRNHFFSEICFPENAKNQLVKAASILLAFSKKI